MLALGKSITHSPAAGQSARNGNQVLLADKPSLSLWTFTTSCQEQTLELGGEGPRPGYLGLGHVD